MDKSTFTLLHTIHPKEVKFIILPCYIRILLDSLWIIEQTCPHAHLPSHACDGGKVKLCSRENNEIGDGDSGRTVVVGIVSGGSSGDCSGNGYDDVCWC